MGDGRHIDPRLGMLEGEASGQRVEGAASAWPTAPPGGSAWSDLPGRRTWSASDPTYYERPLLKEPVWIWAVPVYFWVGGTAGASAVLAAAAQALDGGELRGLVRRCRWVAAAGGAMGTALLIYDLGRPERFLNMLRVFRPTSPMSLGSWTLAGAASLTAGSALLTDAPGPLRALGDVIGYAAALLGMPLAGYTAVLLANTAVPLWQSAGTGLPPLFVSSAVSGAASLFGLMPLAAREEKIVHRFGIAGKAAELAAMTVVERQAGRVAQVGKPLNEGLSGTLWTTAKAMTAASLALSLLPGRSRAKKIAAGLLGTAGAIALRFAVFHAGKASARDPRATFYRQREGQEASATAEPAEAAGPPGQA